MFQNALRIGISRVMPLYIRSGLAKSFCTIQTPAVDSNGTPIIDPLGTPPGTYSNVPGLVNIPCQDAPESIGISAMEVKALSETASIETRHVLLTGYYGQLAQNTNWGDVGWRAVITGADGVPLNYDIIGAESDSQSIMTRLKLRIVTV